VQFRIAVAFVCLIAGCASEAAIPDEGQDVALAPAQLRVLLTDAPAEFDAVWVTITGVEASVETETQQSWVSLVSRSQRFDLLQLRDDVTALLGEASLPAGRYAQLRLLVSDAAVVQAGQERPLLIPSAEHTGIKIIFDADIRAGAHYAVVLDFDAEKSIVRAGDRLLMKPVVHVKSMSELKAEDADAGTETGGDQDEPATADADGGV